MLDINFIRNNTDIVKKSMTDRGFLCDIDSIIAIDSDRREKISQLQEMQSRKRQIADEVGRLKREGRPESEIQKLFEEGDAIGDKAYYMEVEVNNIQAKLDDMLSRIPNILSKDVPIGKDEEDNLEIRVVGEKRKFEFKPKKHYDLLDESMLDFETGVKIAGSRFVVLKGQLAMLDRALKNFMIDLHTTYFGYTEMAVPYIANSDSLFGTGQLPNLEEDLFKLNNEMYLIPTSEVSLVNVVRGDILKEEDLPIRMVGFSPCFRAEAGAAGRDTRGMTRQHQFHKVELVSITTPEQSQAEHERTLEAAEEVLKKLEIPYRVMLLSSGDIGFGSHKTYDIEVWLPGENKYREISSCSNMTDFQSRRMMTRFKKENGKKELVHTLNGSGLAIGRTIIAILENYQQEDGSVAVPFALSQYMNGITKIGGIDKVDD